MKKMLSIGIIAIFSLFSLTAFAVDAPVGVSKQPAVVESKATAAEPIKNQSATKEPATQATAKEKAVPVGRVVWVKGNLTASYNDGKPRNLQKTSVIYLHDTLKTDAKTQAQIVFTDASLMTFKPSTSFYIKDYAYNPNQKAPGSVGKYFMDLIEGGFRTITGLIPKGNPADYQVKTPVATIGVRGTDFVVFVDKKGKTFVGRYDGEPCMKNKNGDDACLTPQKPYGTISSTGAAPVTTTQEPAEIKGKLEIVPVKITPFSAADYAGPMAAGSYGGSSTGGSMGGGNFCIIN